MGNTADNWITGTLVRLDAGRITPREALAKAIEYGRQQSAKATPTPVEPPAAGAVDLDSVASVYLDKALQSPDLSTMRGWLEKAVARLRSLTPPSPAPASPPPVSQETRPMKLVAKAIGDSFNLRWVNLEGREVVANYGIPSRVAQELAHRNNSFEATPDPLEGAGEGRQG